MNLSLGYDGRDLSVEANFHTETPGNTQAANAAAQQTVDGRAVRLYEVAIRFLRDIYQLHLEEGNADE